MSYIIINKSNFFHNLKLISKQIGGIEKLFVVLKDNAYGHGLEEMAELSREFGAKRCAVKTVKEALITQKYLPYTLVLSDIPIQKLNNIGITINHLSSIKKIPSDSLVELKVDTGMHRNGIKPDELESALKLIKDKKLILKGVFTHFRSADELTSEYFWQRENFKEIKKRVKEICKRENLPQPYFHSHNSAAIFRNSNFDEDFARSGISIYGYHYLNPPLQNPPLKPVLSLWAEKLSQRELKKGQRVGYGGVYEAKKDMIVSTYDTGYGDGLFRYNGLGELKVANGKPILGRISMDSFVLEGDDDKVCVFDDATHFAEYFNTITYEIITNLSKDIKRVISE